jgi:hypothetical protein
MDVLVGLRLHGMYAHLWYEPGTQIPVERRRSVVIANGCSK